MNYNDWKNRHQNGTIREYAAERHENDEQIDLSGADLREANLSGADLIEANLSGVNLRWANLSGADLSGADLSGADLIEANLSGADLREANLRGADLIEANLSGADLSGVNLRGANLRGADLRGADLRGADLSGADMRWADLSGADGPFTLGAFGRHGGIAVGGYITIGCERHTYDEWLERYEEIGKRHNYTTDEIADYGAWIHLAVTRQRRIEDTP